MTERIDGARVYAESNGCAGWRFFDWSGRELSAGEGRHHMASSRQAAEEIVALLDAVANRRLPLREDVERERRLEEIIRNVVPLRPDKLPAGISRCSLRTH